MKISKPHTSLPKQGPGGPDHNNSTTTNDPLICLRLHCLGVSIVYGFTALTSNMANVMAYVSVRVGGCACVCTVSTCPRGDGASAQRIAAPLAALTRLSSSKPRRSGPGCVAAARVCRETWLVAGDREVAVVPMFVSEERGISGVAVSRWWCTRTARAGRNSKATGQGGLNQKQRPAFRR